MLEAFTFDLKTAVASYSLILGRNRHAQRFMKVFIQSMSDTESSEVLDMIRASLVVSQDYGSCMTSLASLALA